jgi:hypothetical protein
VPLLGCKGDPDYLLPVRIQCLALQPSLECTGNSHCLNTGRGMLIGGISWINNRNGKVM